MMSKPESPETFDCVSAAERRALENALAGIWIQFAAHAASHLVTEVAAERSVRQVEPAIKPLRAGAVDYLTQVLSILLRARRADLLHHEHDKQLGGHAEHQQTGGALRLALDHLLGDLHRALEELGC